MSEAEAYGVNYLFKLKQSPKVRKLIEAVFTREDWTNADQGWEGVEDELRLTGWTRTRRVIVLRRPIKEPLVLKKKSGQMELSFMETLKPGQVFEYAVLVTSLDDPVLTLAQHYRDRADAENNFDEIKNQWGWGGYTTNDLGRCRIMARVVALVYNWWSLFVRLAIPERHAEAITSRPLLLHAIARMTHHAGQNSITVTSTHAKISKIQRMLEGVNQVLRRLRATAEQLSRGERWRWLLSVIFRHYLGGRLLTNSASLGSLPDLTT
jgi:hypothetical protein